MECSGLSSLPKMAAHHSKKGQVSYEQLIIYGFIILIMFGAVAVLMQQRVFQKNTIQTRCEFYGGINCGIYNNIDITNFP